MSLSTGYIALSHHQRSFSNGFREIELVSSCVQEVGKKSAGGSHGKRVLHDVEYEDNKLPAQDASG